MEYFGDEHGATVYETEITTNRVDAMNHYGVAREASAIYDVELDAPSRRSCPHAKRPGQLSLSPSKMPKAARVTPPASFAG